MLIRPLTLTDTQQVQECLDTQTHFFKREADDEVRGGYMGVVHHACQDERSRAFGVFDGEILVAISVVSIWHKFPAATLRVMCTRNVGRPAYQRDNLIAALDAALAHTEAAGASMLYLLRSADPRGLGLGKARLKLGRLGQYRLNCVEELKAGELSRHDLLSNEVLMWNPVPRDCMILMGTTPESAVTA